MRNYYSTNDKLEEFGHVKFHNETSLEKYVFHYNF